MEWKIDKGITSKVYLEFSDSETQLLVTGVGGASACCLTLPPPFDIIIPPLLATVAADIAKKNAGNGVEVTIKYVLCIGMTGWSVKPL